MSGNNWTALHEAKDVETVQRLLAAGAEVNARDDDFGTPLHYAQDSAIVRLLVDAGAQVNATNKSRETPLHYAKDLEVAKLLIFAGAHVNASNRLGMSPLHLTSKPDIARLLIDAGAQINANSYSGDSPLHRTSDVEVARVLLNRGADVNFCNSRGITPLGDVRRLMLLSKQQDSFELIKLLIDHGADVRKAPSALFYYLWRFSIVRMFLMNGADVKVQFEKHTILEAFAQKYAYLHCSEEVRYWSHVHTSHIHYEDIESECIPGTNISYPACEIALTLDLLLDYGADVNSYVSSPPLKIVLQHLDNTNFKQGGLIVVKKLVAAGAHVEDAETMKRLTEELGVSDERALQAKARDERWIEYLPVIYQRRLYSTSLEKLCIREIDCLMFAERVHSSEEEQKKKRIIEYFGISKEPNKRLLLMNKL